MADDSNQGGTNVPATGTSSPGTPRPAAALARISALAANKQHKRKRPSSLMEDAGSLPSFESSLDDFIARANETLAESSSAFAAARNREKQLAEEDERRREADALRWKAAEQQMREGQAREEALRRQLDRLLGQLAEAEARATLASVDGSQDGIIADLKVRLAAADERIRAADEQARSVDDRARNAEERASKLAEELAAVPTSRSRDVSNLEERLMLAEARAAKAIAAARAASMGLTVNPADIAALESGLVVPMDTGTKATNWALVVAALLVGGVVAFVAAFGIFKNNQDAPEPAAGVAPAPSTLTVTPIAEPATAAPAAITPTSVAAPAASAETPKAEEPAVAKPAAAASPTPAPGMKPAPAKKRTDKKSGAGGIVDPF